MIVENLVTNPSCEMASGTVTVRQNLFANPAAGVDATGFAANYGTGGAGTLSRITGVTGPSGTGITTAVRQVWTTAPTGGTPYVALGSPLTSAAAVVAGGTYFGGFFVRRTTSVSVSYLARLYWFDAANAAISFVDSAAVLVNPSGTWVEIRVSGVAPANAVKAQLYALATTAPFVVNDTMEFTGYIVSTMPGYFDGGTPATGDFTHSWTGPAGASVSTQSATAVASLAGGSSAVRLRSSAWAALGVKSLRLIPSVASNDSFGYFQASNLTVGETYTALGTVRLSAAQTGSLHASARGILVDGLATTYLPGFAAPANAAGVSEVRATFVATATSHQVRFMNGASVAGGDVWWDKLMIVKGSYTDPYVDGDILSDDTVTFTWTGLAHASTSRKVTYLDGTNLTIGRFGAEIRVDDVTGWDESGDRITVTGQTPHGSVPDALTLRQQLMGYIDSPDETFVPVTWADQPEVNGYYRVLSADVSPNPRAAFAGVYDFRVTLARVQGFTTPLIESVLLGKLRTSTMTLTARRTQAIPAGGRSYAEYRTASRILNPKTIDTTRAGPTAVAHLYAPTDDSIAGQFYVPAAKFYEAAATLTIAGKSVVGRQVENKPTDWYLSNDIFEVRPVVADSLQLEFRLWTVTGWSGWRLIRFDHNNVGPAEPNTPLKVPHTVSVLANSPEAVTIRLLTVSSNTYRAPMTVDLTLRRGSRHATVEVGSTFGTFLYIYVSSFAAPEGRTGGWSNTGAEAYTVLGSPQVTFGGVNEFDFSQAADDFRVAFPFCFGLTPTSEGTTGAQNMLNEYFWAASEKQTVVAR